MKNAICPVCRDTQVIHPRIQIKNVTRRFGKPCFRKT